MEKGNCCMNVGLIGLGYWGKILHSKLEKLSDVKFICTSKDIFEDKFPTVKVPEFSEILRAWKGFEASVNRRSL